MQDEKRPTAPLDLMVWRAARAQDVRLTASEVDDLCEAIIRGVWDAVAAAREDREALLAAQFAGVRGQAARGRLSAIQRAYNSREACAARAAQTRGRLEELRARDAAGDLELDVAA